jgi:dihydropteroate synthase
VSDLLYFCLLTFYFLIMFSWQTSRRTIAIDRPLVMGILNATQNSFSDGGRFNELDVATARIEQMIFDGADIIDIGGESTRPGSVRVEANEEIRRVIPIVEAAIRFDVPISIDTSKASVARAAIGVGAEIINDISGLRFDAEMAAAAADTGAGLVLMHSRGDFAEMHSQPAAANIFDEVCSGLAASIETADAAGIADEKIVLDVGIGFGKTWEQNLELLARHGDIAERFAGVPFLIGVSRKSFIGKVLGDVPPDKRLAGSIAAAIYAVERGASIVRTHDVRETSDALRVYRAIIRNEPNSSVS